MQSGEPLIAPLIVQQLTSFRCSAKLSISVARASSFATNQWSYSRAGQPAPILSPRSPRNSRTGLGADPRTSTRSCSKSLRPRDWYRGHPGRSRACRDTSWGPPDRTLGQWVPGARQEFRSPPPPSTPPAPPSPHPAVFLRLPHSCTAVLGKVLAPGRPLMSSWRRPLSSLTAAGRQRLCGKGRGRAETDSGLTGNSRFISLRRKIPFSQDQTIQDGEGSELNAAAATHDCLKLGM